MCFKRLLSLEHARVGARYGYWRCLAPRIEAQFRSMRRTLTYLTLVLALWTFVAKSASADYVISRSPLYSGVFLYYELIPIAYSWQGSARVDFTRSGSYVTIRRVDQTVLVHDARRFGNPVGIQGAVNMDVLEDGWRYVGTIYVAAPGSYIIGVNHLIFGGVTNLSWTVRNPTFRVNTTVVATRGYGLYRRSWTFRP